MIETIKRLIGYRKYGAINEEDKEYVHKTPKASQIEVNHPDFKYLPQGLINSEIKNQGNTNRCTAYSVATIIETMLTRRLHQNIDIDPKQIWDMQLKTGGSEKKGDRIFNPLDQVVKNGLEFVTHDINGVAEIRKVTFDSKHMVKPDEWDKWIKDGHPIASGLDVYGNIIDKTYQAKFTGKLRGAHAVPILASYGNFRLQNSWGESWGLKGTFFLNHADRNKMYSSYVLLGMNIV